MNREEYASFTDFYAREYRRAATLATVMLGDTQRGSDLAQEVFTGALRRWDTIRSYERPDLWIRRAVINRSISERRRQTSEVKLLSRLAARRADPLPMHVESSGIWRLVGTLPRRQAQAIALVYGDDLSVEDAALAMRCSSGAVKSHLHRGRHALAALWRQADEQ